MTELAELCWQLFFNKDTGRKGTDGNSTDIIMDKREEELQSYDGETLTARITGGKLIFIHRFYSYFIAFEGPVHYLCF